MIAKLLSRVRALFSGLNQYDPVTGLNEFGETREETEAELRRW